MRILFLTSEFPYPPYAGAPLRNFGLITGLAAEHEVWLLSFRAGALQETMQTPLHACCREIRTFPVPERGIADRLRDLILSERADLACRYDAPVFAGQLREWLEAVEFDLIQIENLEMAVFLPIIKATRPDVPILYDAHNAEYALQERIYQTERGALSRLPGAAYSYVQARRIRRLEYAVCRQVDYIVAVSDTDATLLRRLGCQTPIAVVPNGILSDRYDRPDTAGVTLESVALVFTGKMDYRPNVDATLWFAEEVLPLIRHELSDAHFYVVGQSPHPRLDVLRGRAGITLTGLVPDVLPFLQAASTFVVPLRIGSGTRLKVLEAMAAGCPIVSTRTGAEGLYVTDGRELLLADTAKEFAQAVVRLHREPEQARQLGLEARRFVRERYDWSVLLPRLIQVYKELGLV